MVCIYVSFSCECCPLKSLSICLSSAKKFHPPVGDFENREHINQLFVNLSKRHCLHCQSLFRTCVRSRFENYSAYFNLQSLLIIRWILLSHIHPDINNNGLFRLFTGGKIYHISTGNAVIMRIERNGEVTGGVSIRTSNLHLHAWPSYRLDHRRSFRWCIGKTFDTEGS